MRNRGKPIDFRIVLGVHDALLFELPVISIPKMMGGFVDYCMSTLAKIPMPDTLDCHGLYSCVHPDKFPYALCLDKSLFLRWDEKPPRDELAALGVPEMYLPKAN
jgi:hypothetical protein